MKKKILHLINRRIADLKFYIDNMHNDATGFLLYNSWIHAQQMYEEIYKDLVNKPDAYWENDDCLKTIIDMFEDILVSESRKNVEGQFVLKHFYMYKDCDLIIADMKKL